MFPTSKLGYKIGLAKNKVSFFNLISQKVSSISILDPFLAMGFSFKNESHGLKFRHVAIWQLRLPPERSSKGVREREKKPLT